MSIEKDRDADERSPLYVVRVNFKKSILYGDRSGPGVAYSMTYTTYTTKNTKAEIVKQLYGYGIRLGGIWAAQETVWIPCDMFESIEFQRRDQ